MKTLQDYIKLAGSAEEFLPSINLEFYRDSVKTIPAMAKALIEAEEVIAGLSANVQVLSNVIKDPNAGTDFQKRFVLEVAKDAVEAAKKALAQIQALNGEQE